MKAPLAVAPLRITLPSAIPKRQSQGAKDRDTDENHGEVLCLLVLFVWGFFNTYCTPQEKQEKIKMTLWSPECLFLYTAVAK